jgi:hypothetical protein
MKCTSMSLGSTVDKADYVAMEDMGGREGCNEHRQEQSFQGQGLLGSRGHGFSHGGHGRGHDGHGDVVAGEDLSKSAPDTSTLTNNSMPLAMMPGHKFNTCMMTVTPNAACPKPSPKPWLQHSKTKTLLQPLLRRPKWLMN